MPRPDEPSAFDDSISNPISEGDKRIEVLGTPAAPAPADSDPATDPGTPATPPPPTATVGDLHSLRASASLAGPSIPAPATPPPPGAAPDGGASLQNIPAGQTPATAQEVAQLLQQGQERDSWDMAALNEYPELRDANTDFHRATMGKVQTLVVQGYQGADLIHMAAQLAHHDQGGRQAAADADRQRRLDGPGVAPPTRAPAADPSTTVPSFSGPELELAETYGLDLKDPDIARYHSERMGRAKRQLAAREGL